MTVSDIHQRAAWIAALGGHLARVVTSLLPDDRDLVSSGSQLLVMARGEGGRPVVATSLSLPDVDGSGELSWITAAYLLADLQDEIAIHLGRAWPVGRSGASLTARATDLGGSVGLAFVPGSGDERDTITLEPFVPPDPVRSRTAG